MMDKELRDWIDKSLNETATEEESWVLEERLLRDESARDQYLNAVNVHASLRRRFSAAAESPETAQVESFPAPNRRIFSLGLAAAAALAFIAGIAALLLPSKPVGWLPKSWVLTVGKGSRSPLAKK